MQCAVDALRRRRDRPVRIFHHNDADGLCSGAVLSRAFERDGRRTHRFSLEKPYPAVLRKVFEADGDVIVFADFAGRIAPMLAELNGGRNLVLILDHHVAEQTTDETVHNLDPTLYGMKGDRDISGSVTAYLFATVMNSQNRDLAPVAVVGAVGDEFFVDGCLAGENRSVALDAVTRGAMEIRARAAGERYHLKTSRGLLPCDILAAELDTLGAAGYYRNGPDLGVKLCLEGPNAASDQMLTQLRAIQHSAFDAEIARLKSGGLLKTPHLQWFHVQERFAPMGVKMIGVFLDAVKSSEFIDPDRYLAGFQFILDDIPGFGPVGMRDVKISMRTTAPLASAIQAGTKPGLDVLLPKATALLGGFSDACHTLTAATTVAIGREEQLIEEMEHFLAESD